MTITGPGAIDREYLGQFFRDHEVDVVCCSFAIALRAPPGRKSSGTLPEMQDAFPLLTEDNGRPVFRNFPHGAPHFSGSQPDNS